MNILYHFRTRGIGAEAVHISGIATAFEKLGHRVVFSSPTGADPRKTAGASPYRGSGKTRVLAALSRFASGVLFELLEIGYNIAAFWRNRRILKSESFDLIYERYAFFLVATAWLARRYQVPLVVEVNELVGDARLRKQPLLAPIVRKLDRYVFRRATLIVVVSSYLKHRIEAVGISGKKILVLPNAVDGDEYVEVAAGCEMRRRLGLEEKIVIGFVGWFVEWHRLDLLVEAFAALADTRPALRLVLVGEGPLHANLQRQIRRLGLDGRVVFPGPVSHREIPAAIAAMDICVVPHSNEFRSPIKLFEYMGQGKTVVAPATEPVAMVVRDGANGLLFEPGDAGDFARALARAADDAGLRNRLGEQARRDVLAKHTWVNNAQAVLKPLPLLTVSQ